MELNIVEEKKNKLILEVKGGDNTVCNTIKAELWNDEHVKAAGSYVSHPQVGTPRLIIETDTSTTPKKALQDAVKRLKKDVEKFRSGVKSEIKG